MTCAETQNFLRKTRPLIGSPDVLDDAIAENDIEHTIAKCIADVACNSLE